MYSFNTTDLLASTNEEQLQSSTRNYCNSCGYESVALIPIKTEGERIGLIQLNDIRTGMFTEDLIGYLEMIVEQTRLAVRNSLIYTKLGETAEKANECGINNFLFDLRNADNRTNLSDHYNMVYKHFLQMGFKSISKHALLVSQKDMHDYSFVGTILRNAGYQSNLFTDELPAIEWLEK